MKIPAVLAIALLAGCRVVYPIDKPISLDLHGQPETLVDFAQGAVDLWAQHDVTFTIAPDLHGEVPIRVGDSGAGTWADYTYEGPHAGEVLVQPELLVSQHGECTVAHELGHAVGLHHDSQADSLMSAYLTLCTWLDDNPCCWDALDDMELCRAGGPCASAP